jgi:phospholipase C
VNLSTPRRAASIAVAAVAAASLVAVGVSTSSAAPVKPASVSATATPIKHLVVIFDENVSYDHYFGTYPKAANTNGSKFHAAPGTPKNNNLITSGKLTSNANLYKPARLSKAQGVTCDQNHAYGPEQAATDNGKMDKFVQNVSVDTCTGLFGTPGLAMDYYDGNTTTGLWNWAQQYSMSDNSYDSTFGPSTPGALNLVSGQTHGFKEIDSTTGLQVATPGSYVLASPNSSGVGTVINDPDPAYDDCSDTNHTATNTLAAGTGKNIGDLLNAKNVTWGWFQGGFRPTQSADATNKYAVCGAKHANINGASVVDYSPHHNPFQYYKSTSNPHHLPPTSVAKIGHTDQANHQYALTDFTKALQANNLPAVSFLKAGEYQDGHAGYSDPIDEQHFLVREINELQRSPEWSSTAVVIAYDDSDGWYDHQFATITNASHDAPANNTVCTSSTAPVANGYADRCGPGPRLPLLVISPYARTNFIDHHETEQASVLKFIESNWKTAKIGDGSFETRAGSLNPMFNFKASDNKRVILNQTGTVRRISRIKPHQKDRHTKVVWH